MKSSSSSDDEDDCPSSSLLPSSDDDEDESYRDKRELSFLDLDLRLLPDDRFDLALEAL